jgi:hypothetical protein
VIHVYGITDPGGPAPAVRGIDDRAVRRLDGAGAAAVVTEHEQAPAPEAEVLLRHAQVVEQLAAIGPVLPARFGTGAADEADVLDRLADPSLPDALERVRGRIEIAVRIVSSSVEPDPDPDPEPDAGPQPEPGRRRTGREHLAALAARRAAIEHRHAESDDRVAAARSRLERLADDVVLRPAGSPRVLWHAALLLPTSARDAFEGVVAETADALAPDLALLCTGPWPPYSFTADPAVERSSA